MRLLVTFAVLVGVAGTSALARAQERESEPAPTVAPAAPAPARPIHVRPLERRWDDGPDRWFLSGLIDIGPLYLRPRLSAGWGRPHFRWVGVDVNPIISGEGLGAYAGIRGTLPQIDLRVGVRYFSTFFRSLLEPREHYNRLALEIRAGPVSRYLTAEAELSTSVSFGPASIPLVLTGAYVALVPGDYYVFEDVIRIVAAPPWIWAVRTGFDVKFGAYKLLRIGLVGEVVGSPERPLRLDGDRDSAIVARVGVAGSYRLWDILEIRASLVPAVYSPDTLGALAGQWFEIGLRFRFATGVDPALSLPSL